MKESLYMMVDVSGSMAEMGKIHLQRNLCRYAAQIRLISPEKYASINIHFYQWAYDISEFSLQRGGDIPPFNAEGSSNLSELTDVLSQKMNHAEILRVLILSDGSFNHNDYEKFLSWKQQQKRLLIRTVAVGADADLFKLKKISTNNMVYLSENIASAINSTIFGSDEPLTAPVSIAHILQSEQAEPEEDWDV